MRSIYVLCFFFLIFESSISHAENDSVWILGPSFGYVTGGPVSSRWTPGVDCTLGHLDPSFWISGGIQGRFGGSNSAVVPYFEMGTWKILNVGIGSGVEFNSSKVNPAVHLFLGIPIPLVIPDQSSPGNFPFIEPYYRPRLNLKDGETSHELGILVKIILDTD